MFIFSIFTKVCSCAAPKSKGGGVGALLAAVLLLVAAGVLYRTAEGTLLGLQASAAETNRIIAIAFAVVLVVLAIAGGIALVVGRKRAVQADAVEQDWHAYTAQVQAARRTALEPARTRALPVGPVRTPSYVLDRVEAVRVDRIDQG